MSFAAILQTISMNRSWIASTGLLAMAFCFWLASIALCLGTINFFGHPFDATAKHELERQFGKIVETYPNGSTKVRHLAITVTDAKTSKENVFEKWEHFDEKGNPTREVIKTPTLETVKEAEPSNGHWKWRKMEVIRDERTFIGKLGLPLVFWPYYAGSAILGLAGVFVLGIGAILILKRRHA